MAQAFDMTNDVAHEQLASKGCRITLNFALKLPDGEIVDSTFDKKPASLIIGDGNLPVGFESLLIGLCTGDRRSFVVGPEQAFGQSNPNNLQRFRRDQFSADLALELGLMVSFADAKKQELAGVVAEITEDEVVVDFNHPLAGRELTFEVEIITIEPEA